MSRRPTPLLYTASENLVAAVATLVADTVMAALVPQLFEMLTRLVAEAVRRGRLPLFLTREQLADETGWSLSKIDALRRERRIAHIKHGRTVRFETAEVERFFSAARVPPVPNARPPP